MSASSSSFRAVDVSSLARARIDTPRARSSEGIGVFAAPPGLVGRSSSSESHTESSFLPGASSILVVSTAAVGTWPPSPSGVSGITPGLPPAASSDSNLARSARSWSIFASRCGGLTRVEWRLPRQNNFKKIGRPITFNFFPAKTLTPQKFRLQPAQLSAPPRKAGRLSARRISRPACIGDAASCVTQLRVSIRGTRRAIHPRTARRSG